jgi:hypothetical protein
VAQRRSDKSLSDDQGEGLAVSFERSLPQAEAMGGEHRPDSVTKQELESYLAQYSAQNYINHRAALSNLFGYGLKVGAAPENPLSTIEKPRIRPSQTADLERYGICGSAAGGVADVDNVLQIEFVDQRRQVVGVGVHVIAVPWLTGAAVAATIMCDATEAARGQEEHLVFP